jgi:hypothetical protein
MSAKNEEGKKEAETKEKVVKKDEDKADAADQSKPRRKSSSEGKKKSPDDSTSVESSGDKKASVVKKARSKKKSRHHTNDTVAVSKSLTLKQKKEKDDLEERKDMEKNLARLTQQLAALQERMYSIRFDDSVEVEAKHLELRNFANQILFCERQIALAYREAIEVFEDQLNLHEIALDGVLDPIHASEVSDAELTRTGNFMRTPSTQTVQGKEPRKKWQAAFKMIKEKKDQTAVAEGQYVTSRDSSMADLDGEITKLRNAVMALRGRKNLNQRDERTLELMQEQLKVRVQQKERYARQLLGAAQ